MNTLIEAILQDDRTKTKKLLRSNSELATSLLEKARLFDSEIFHWIYGGDTALHLAAAGYRVEIVEMLLVAGADPNSSTNHRQSGPLHYAADGFITGPAWDAKRQVKTIQMLIDAGAKINAQDKNGATPLHRAVRTRCALAVKCLLQFGSDPTIQNKSGSTPFHLAVQNTGRGGSGTKEAKTAQRQIIEVFLSFGVSPSLQDSKGKSVLDWAKSEWIQQLLSENRTDAKVIH